MSYVLIALLCLAAGAVAGWYAARARLAAETATMTARWEASRENEARLEQSLRALNADAAAASKTALGEMLTPLRESLHRYERHVGEIERARLSAYSELRTQVAEATRTGEALRDQTGRLVSALRAPQVRGRWGEHQLRRIVEAAGMLEHCDFTEQVSVTGDGGRLRPDLVVRLAGGKNVVVDAKAPFNAYLDAMESQDEAARESHLDQHSRHLRAHVDQLSKKEYWRAFDVTPEFVVLFVPADAFLDSALQRDTGLLEYAFSRDIVVATPATLIAMLRTIAYVWRQDALAQNATEIHALGREMYGRLATMGGHLAKLGTSLSGAVTAYNSTIGSLESRVMVTARKFAELGVSDAGLPEPEQVETTARQLQHEALRAAADDSLISLEQRRSGRSG
ncbi:DNA recombination protein RmuC [Stackebrandtia albiflava]|uniref:DNA recombination protein RmuC n=1 Tax=Stackebrandtia albiflava TaxID=406432 RepID=A0A562UPP5_9ACTN|nr:DNA recombination protein RmuC [Stackebrandtia albiflava]TWJ07566.1 DNA recombination protein RmuC [Stackebrandtia albiflava]